MRKSPVGFAPITVPSVKSHVVEGEIVHVIVEHLTTTMGPASFEGRHAHMLLTRNQAEVLVRRLAAELGLLVLDVEPIDHEKGYDPERDDFDDEIDTPEDYEGDRYTGGATS